MKAALRGSFCPIVNLNSLGVRLNLLSVSGVVIVVSAQSSYQSSGLIIRGPVRVFLNKKYVEQFVRLSAQGFRSCQVQYQSQKDDIFGLQVVNPSASPLPGESDRLVAKNPVMSEAPANKTWERTNAKAAFQLGTNRRASFYQSTNRRAAFQHQWEGCIRFASRELIWLQRVAKQVCKRVANLVVKEQLIRFVKEQLIRFVKEQLIRFASRELIRFVKEQLFRFVRKWLFSVLYSGLQKSG